MDPIELLAREGRWQLSAGEGLTFAPPHPLWLHAPGFWDGASVVGDDIAPLFTIAVLNDDGVEIGARITSRRWSPAEISAEYRLEDDVTATEVRTVQPGGVLASEWRIEASRPTRLHLIAWTAQPKAALDGPMRYEATVIFGRRSRTPGVSHEIALGCVGGPTSWALARSEAAPLYPRWRFTPFVGQWTNDGLPPTSTSIEAAEVTYAAVHKEVFVGGEGAAIVFAMRVTSAGDAARSRRTEPAAAHLSHAATLGGASRNRWRDYFDRMPSFRCSDPYVEHCYWYRWSCLELLAAGSLGICEGAGQLHRITSDGTACHANELRWMHEPATAQQAVRTALERMRADGSIPFHIAGPADSDTSHVVFCGWGEALLGLDAVHPDDAFVGEVYVHLARHARWILRERINTTGLVEVMRGEVAFDDGDRWANGDRVCAIDAAVSTYDLFGALARLAPRAGSAKDATEWHEVSKRLARAVREYMWDDTWKLFRDVDPHTGERVGPRSAVCFYPYATDLADARQLPGLEESLLNPRAFWTTFPVASAPANDERFSRIGARENIRGLAPFSGPVVPRVNSHLIDALARAARTYAPHLRPHVVHLIRRTIRMFFVGTDPARVGSYEYYDPVEGRPAAHRPSSDDTRSWVIDAIVQYVAGVRPHQAGLTIDPMPFGMELVDLAGVRVRGRTLDVHIEGDRVTATLDGVAREGRVGTPMEIAM